MDNWFGVKMLFSKELITSKAINAIETSFFLSIALPTAQTTGTTEKIFKYLFI